MDGSGWLFPFCPATGGIIGLIIQRQSQTQKSKKKELSVLIQLPVCSYSVRKTKKNRDGSGRRGSSSWRSVSHLFAVLVVVHALLLVALLNPLAKQLHDRGRVTVARGTYVRTGASEGEGQRA